MRTVDAAGLPIGDGHPPRIMGVLNLSPDSPYEPSVFEEPATAAEYAEGLVAEGADIVDVGLESANKRFAVRDADWELDRLDLAVEAVERVERDAVFSLETRYAEVADAALDGPFDAINDIAGFADPRMPDVCAAHDAPVVKMAGPGDVTRPGAIESVDEIYDALADGLTDKTIVDPAFGGWSEAKTLADDRETFRRLREFRGLGRPILVSINRKNFLREVAGRSTEDALPVSLAATSMAVERGAHVIRTHDVAATRDAALIGHALGGHRERFRDDRIEELHVETAREARRHTERLGLDADPTAAVARAFELSGLGDDALLFANVARDAGAAVAVEDARGFLAGPAAALERVATRLVDTDLDDVGAGIEAALSR